jgi:hypothetical protein
MSTRLGNSLAMTKERMEPGPKMYISHGATHLAARKNETKLNECSQTQNFADPIFQPLSNCASLSACIILSWQKMTRQSMKSIKPVS